MNPGDKLIQKPVYPGGRKALSAFLATNLVYPKDALENKIEGLVIVFIDIDGKGKVVRTRVKKKLGHGCDEEAVRLVKLLKFFVVNMRKVRITHHKNIKIHFRLPKPTKEVKQEKKSVSTPPSSPVEVVYTYVPTKK